MRMKIVLGVSFLGLVIGILVAGCARKAEMSVERSRFPAEMMEGREAPPGAAAMPQAKGAARPSFPSPAASQGAVPPGAPAAEYATAQSPASAGSKAAVYSTPEQKALQAAVSRRKLISKAWRTVKVKDVEEAYEKAAKMATDAGGFVEASSMEKGTEEKERQAELVLRVPADSLEKVMGEVAKLGEVLSTKMQGEDVTEQWVDLEARIRNLRWQEEQLLKIMKEKAKTLDELLRMQTEVARLRGEIEQNEGRMTLLRDQVSLATLYLTLVEKGVAVKPVPSGSWALGATFTHALRAALGAARSVVGFLIWFFTLGILWIPAVVVLLLLTRYAVKKVQAAFSAKPLPTESGPGQSASE